MIIEVGDWGLPTTVEDWANNNEFEFCDGDANDADFDDWDETFNEWLLSVPALLLSKIDDWLRLLLDFPLDLALVVEFVDNVGVLDCDDEFKKWFIRLALVNMLGIWKKLDNISARLTVEETLEVVGVEVEKDAWDLLELIGVPGDVLPWLNAANNELLELFRFVWIADEFEPTTKLCGEGAKGGGIEFELVVIIDDDFVEDWLFEVDEAKNDRDFSIARLP